MQCQKQNDKNKILKKIHLFVRFSGGGGNYSFSDSGNFANILLPSYGRG